MTKVTITWDKGLFSCVVDGGPRMSMRYACDDDDNPVVVDTAGYSKEYVDRLMQGAAIVFWEKNQGAIVPVESTWEDVMRATTQAGAWG